MSQEEKPSSPADAGTVFAEWLADWVAHAAPSFDSLCRDHPSIAGELRGRLAALAMNAGAELDRAADARASGAAPGSDPPRAAGSANGAWSSLVAHRHREPRYQVRGEIARGGMGAILKVWDDTLDRSLAMKVMLGAASSPAAAGTPETPPVDDLTLSRFLDEAKVTGQLDHPGIVPVHELGLDADGRVFFTMKLVKGRDLKAVFDLVFSGKEAWSETRALGVLLKVCEAMAYAHSKGVIHRDLKPSNVMVGSFGEVYVMDFGLARVQGKKDGRDLRPRVGTGSISRLRTIREARTGDTPDSPIFTMDGTVVGTPAYMPPEQAYGEAEKLCARSDVYSIGAMLYHLLARQAPYVPPGVPVTPRTVLAAVIAGPPAPLLSLRRDIPPELVSIVEKAMAREAGRRYASTAEFADDLRAYLEHRVVRAYETGAVAELRKWVLRNKPLAATAVAAVLSLVALLVVVNEARVAADASALEAHRLESVARENEGRAEAAAAQAKSERDRVLRLSDLQRLRDLKSDSARLWPARPESVEALERLVASARSLAGNLESHRARLAGLRSAALPCDEGTERLDRETHPEAARRPTWRFAGAEDAWQHGLMEELVAGVEGLLGEDDSWSAFTIAAFERRLEFARTVTRVTIDDERPAWESAIAEIARSPAYGGLRLAPQLGLVPIGRDPDSGLFEFWHVQSGGRPARGGDGRIVPGADMGIVLVLVPGARFTMGAFGAEGGREHNPWESPAHEVTLDPYFISKYEMTQGQWSRFTGSNPSVFQDGRYGEREITPLNPVEQVSWTACREVLSRLDLDFPTEAQWERAARGGTLTPWWTGADRESLRGKVNIADQALSRAGGGGEEIKDWPDLDDGYAAPAPAGSFPANPFGLHEITGNVWEWCRDLYGGFDLPARAGDGERDVAGAKFRMLRGGSFLNAAGFARAATRSRHIPAVANDDLGVRPARRVAGERD